MTRQTESATLSLQLTNSKTACRSMPDRYGAMALSSDRNNAGNPWQKKLYWLTV